MKKKVGMGSIFTIMVLILIGCAKSSAPKIETEWEVKYTIAEMLGYADGISGEVKLKLTFYTDKTFQLEITKTHAELTAEDTITELDGSITKLNLMTKTMIEMQIDNFGFSFLSGIFKGTFTGNTKQSTENNNEVRLTANQFKYQDSEEFEEMEDGELSDVIVTIGNNTLTVGDWEFKKIK